MSRRFPPPWTVEDFRVIPYDGWNGHVTGAKLPELLRRRLFEPLPLLIQLPT